MTKSRRPNNLKRVMQWLEDNGYRVYGIAYHNLDTAEEEDGGNQDFSYDDIVRVERAIARRDRKQRAIKDEKVKPS